MARAKPVRKESSRCELTRSPAKRRAADARTAAIQHQFPAGLAQPALRALASAGYQRLEQLAKVRENELLQLHGMGPKALATLRAALLQQGLSFKA